jgi:hypothetical protein
MNTMTRVFLAAALCAMPTVALAQQSESAVPVGGPVRPAPRAEGTGPNGATMRCRDGTHPAATAPATACDARGGVLVRYPMRVTPQAAPARPAPAAARQAIQTRPAPDSSIVPWRQRTAQDRAAEAAARPPAGATLHCNDGTWIARDTSSTRCSPHGGVKTRIAPQARVELKRRGQ